MPPERWTTSAEQETRPDHSWCHHDGDVLDMAPDDRMDDRQHDHVDQQDRGHPSLTALPCPM
jgi:hypothetical protein